MHADIVTNDLLRVVNAIEIDEVVAFPTGTVYGLAVNTLSTIALDTLRIIKKRPDEKTFTVFLDDSLVNRFFEISNQENLFLQKAKNIPLTILLKPKTELKHLSHNNLVGMRIIDNPLMKTLAEAVKYPLTATSANVSGEEPCLSPSCISRNLSAVKYIYGDLELSPARPSTIARVYEKEVEIIREGSLSKEYLDGLI